MTAYQNIYIFKTDKNAQAYLSEVAHVMENFDDQIRWITDLEDCDKILKVETDSIKSSEIMEAMRKAGFYCEELN